MNELENRVNELDDQNAAVAKKYFTNGDILQKIFDVVRKNFDIIEPMGNYDSDIVILINDDLSLNNNVIKIIKKFYDVNNRNMYDTYITSYSKTSNDKINTTLVQKEISILKPRRVIYLGMNSLNGDNHFLNKVEFDLFKSSIGNADLIVTPEYAAVKNKFVQLMKYIITGVD